MDPPLNWPELVGKLKLDTKSNIVNNTLLISIALEGVALPPLQAGWGREEGACAPGAPPPASATYELYNITIFKHSH